MRFDFLRSSKWPRVQSACKVLLLLALAMWAASAAEAQKVTDSLTVNRPQAGADQSKTNSARPQTSQSRSVTALRRSETPQGSRLSIISDGTLNDYSAYRMGDRFFIIIPRARAPVKQPGSGQGFAQLRVEPRGNDLLLSFRVPEGRNARVSQRFNKLDILLESSGASASSTNGNSNSAADTRNKNANKNEAEGQEAVTASSPEIAEAVPTPPVEATSATTEQTTATGEIAQAQQGPASTTAPPSNPAASGAPVGASGVTTRNWFPVLILTALLLALIGLLWFGHARQQQNGAEQAIPTSAEAGMSSPPEFEGSPTLAVMDDPRAEIDSPLAEEILDEEEDTPAREENLLSQKIQDSAESEMEVEAAGINAAEINNAPLLETVEPEEKGAPPEQASLPEELPAQAAHIAEQVTLSASSSSELEAETASPDVHALFDDPAEEVRNRAARALYEQRADRVGAFTAAIREADPERRRKIGAAIASSGLAKECIGQLTGSSSESAIEAFSLLFLMLKAGEIEPLMTAVSKHPETEVRLAVIRLFALSEDAELLPLLRRLSSQGALPVRVRSALKQTIYQLSMLNGR